LKTTKSKPLTLFPIQNIPDIHPGDDIGGIVIDAISEQGEVLIDGDIIVFTQKIISKAENRYVKSTSIVPSKNANKLAIIVQKPPELIELILRESRAILRLNERTIIVEHNLGFICANAGIDQSNVDHASFGEEGGVYLLLPKNPDKSANQIRKQLEKFYKARLGVMIIDSHGRAWRLGTVGTAIGLSGLPGLVDLRGMPDLYGRELKITRVGAADELAGAASLVMGQANENTPVVIARGFPYGLREAEIEEILRPPDMDLFR